MEERYSSLAVILMDLEISVNISPIEHPKVEETHLMNYLEAIHFCQTSGHLQMKDDKSSMK